MRFRQSAILLLSAFFAATQQLRAGDDFGLWTEVSVEKSLCKHLSADFGYDFRTEQNLDAISRNGVSLGLSYKPFKTVKFGGKKNAFSVKFGTGYAFLRDRNPQEFKGIKIKENYNKEGERNGWNVDSIIDHGYWRNKHRAWFDVSAKLTLGCFSLSVRERYQFTLYKSTQCVRDRYRQRYRDENDLSFPGYGPWYPLTEERLAEEMAKLHEFQGAYYEEYTGYDDPKGFERQTDNKAEKRRHYLRSRFALDYNIPHCPVDPFVTVEFSNNLSEGMNLEKTRYTVGLDWKINKQHTLSLAYLYDDGQDDDSNGNLHVLEVGYKFKF